MDSHSIASIFNLDGQVAVITGGSRGIGEEIARVFGLAGARVVVSSRRPEGIEEAAGRLRKTGVEVLPVVTNVSHAEDRKNLIKAAMNWGGRIDVLVNNAGTNPAYGPLEDISESAWDKIFEVNLKACFVLSQLAFHAWMKDHGGCILNTASVGGFSTSRGTNIYNITKAALIHLTKCLASEWGQYGIRVNALAPGVIKTVLSRALWDNPQAEARFKASPMGRAGEVQDIAGAALLLASGAGAYINGETLIIDGGSRI